MDLEGSEELLFLEVERLALLDNEDPFLTQLVT